jgi:phosphoglycolate phosphatase-like HAD superfamily hydrolase
MFGLRNSTPIFLLEAGKRLNVSMSRWLIMGDSVWDSLAARRASALSISLIGRLWTRRTGASRRLLSVSHDPADPLRHLCEMGLRLASKKI